MILSSLLSAALNRIGSIGGVITLEPCHGGTSIALGRLLAGELKAPGSYSYRTLDFIRNLSTDEAKTLNVSRGLYHRLHCSEPVGLLDEEGISFGNLLEMQNLGVISELESVGLSITFASAQEDHFVKPLCSHGRVLLVKHEDPKKDIKLQA
jgi:hypothetical protein